MNRGLFHFTKSDDIVQEAMIKTIPKKKKCKRQNDCLRRPYLAEKRREAKGKGEGERHSQLNSAFQRKAKRDTKAFLSEQCKGIEENNKMGKTRDLFEKTGDIREYFMQKWAQ